MADLSGRRQRALAIVREVCPSAYPDSKFTLLTGGIDLSSSTLPAGYTTCGSLPAYVARKLGGNGMIACGGLDSLRTAAKKAGAWVPGSGGFAATLAGMYGDGPARPQPGDLYALCQGSSPDGLIVHVGMIVDASSDLWVTADAGQGKLPDQKAAYSNRRYNSGMLTGEVTTNGNRPARLVAGWVDLDAYPFS